MSNFSGKKVTELKDLLRAHGLPVSGNKPELLERLMSVVHSLVGNPLAANPPAVNPPAENPQAGNTTHEQDDADDEDDFQDVAEDGTPNINMNELAAMLRQEQQQQFELFRREAMAAITDTLATLTRSLPQNMTPQCNTAAQQGMTTQQHPLSCTSAQLYPPQNSMPPQQQGMAKATQQHPLPTPKLTQQYPSQSQNSLPAQQQGIGNATQQHTSQNSPSTQRHPSKTNMPHLQQGTESATPPLLLHQNTLTQPNTSPYSIPPPQSQQSTSWQQGSATQPNPLSQRTSDASPTRQHALISTQPRNRCEHRQNQRTQYDDAFERMSQLHENASESGWAQDAQRSRPGHSQNYRYAVSHAAENMPEFDPDSSEGKIRSSKAFMARLRALQDHYDWDDFVLLEAAQQKLRGQAKVWNDESPDVYKTFASFEADLLAAFPYYASTTGALEEILAQKRRTNETIEEFCRRMTVLGRRARVPDEDLAQYVIKRINHTQFVTSVGCVRIRSMSELLQAVAFYNEKMPYNEQQSSGASQRPDSGPRQPSTSNHTTQQRFASNTNGAAATSKPTSTSTAPHSRPAATPRCFNCRAVGHTLSDCKEPILKCANCQRHGHLAKDCRSESRPKRVFRIDGDDEYNNDRINLCKQITINNLQATAYIDGGSHMSLVGRSFAEKVANIESTTPIYAKGFTGDPVRCSEKIRADIVVEDQIYTGDMFVVDDEYLEGEDVILGIDILCGVGRFLLIGDNKCTIVPKLADPADANQPHVHLLSEFQHCFSDTLDNLGKSNTAAMEIHLSSERPISQRACRIPFAKRAAVNDIINDLLAHGIITLSTSPYSSQLVVVKKPSGEDRLCVDYRELNSVTIRQPYPMPIIEELLAKLAGYRYFSVLDFMSGYYQIPVHPDSRKYTAFDTHEGHFEFTRMPFGLVNAPSVFQAAINELLKKLPPGEAMAYLDDVIIPSRTIDEGIERLRRFLIIIGESGLTLRSSKCVFLSERVKFLGHKVSQNAIEPGDDKVRAIREFPAPSNPQEARRFLGLTNFFRKFVQNYAQIAKPLSELLKTVNNPPFVWGSDQAAAFDTLKQHLCNAPVLCLYDMHQDHEVHTDASSVGLAGVLMQKSTDGKFHPVAYFSRHCNSAEQNYASHELEVLAIVESLERYRVYLMGKRFRVITDCAAVTTTKNSKPLVPRIARWWLKLQEYDFDMEHRAGTQLAYVDALSRAPVEPAREPTTVTERLMRVSIEETDWLVTMQLQDNDLLRIMKVLRGDEKSEDESQIRADYDLDGNRLFRKVNGNRRWVVPKAVRWRVVKSAHDDRGHFGMEKTIKYLQDTFWFARMRNFVKNYLQACIECAYHKRPGGKTEGQLHTSKTDPTPFRTIHLDHLGPFPRSSKGHAYVLAIVDSFSKYVMVKAVRTTDTRAVIIALGELSTFFGVPARIVSDRGTAFTSKSFADYCERNGIQHIKNAVRTPRANGQVERINQMITTFLRVGEIEERKWDIDLSRFQIIVNSQANKTTGISPNDIVFRFKLRNATDNKLVAALHDLDDWAEAKDVPTLEEIARRADEEKSRWKTRYDERHSRPKQYSEQDLVLVENQPSATGESRKLEPRYRGPYVIKKVLDNDRYLVADLKDIQRNQRYFESVFASDKIKPWCSLGSEIENDDDEEPNIEDEDQAEVNENEFALANEGVEGDANSGTAELSATPTPQLEDIE